MDISLSRVRLAAAFLIASLAAAPAVRAEINAIDSPLHVIAGVAPEYGLGLRLDAAAYDSIKRVQQVQFRDFALPDGASVTLSLEQFEIYAPNAQIVLGTAGGDQPMPRPDVVLLRGTIEGEADSRVFLGLSPLGTNGYILRGDRKLLIAEPADHSAPIMIYDPAQLPPGALQAVPFTCGSENLPAAEPVLADPLPLGGPAPRDTAGCRVINLAVETDYEYTNRIFGGNTTNSAAYIATLFGADSEVYTAEVQSRFQIVYQRVWASDVDPYQTGSTIDTRLNEFGLFWNQNMTSIVRNTTHMLSGQSSGAGGIAYLGVLCPSNPGYGVSGYLRGSFPYPLQNNNSLNWDVVVTTHEIGHNFNAPHTHGMSPPIDCCGGNASDGGNCGNVQNCSLAAQGTIMSYCHTCAGGVANIALNFHQRIRDERMLPYLNSNPQCVTFSSDVAINASPSPQNVAAGDVLTLVGAASGGPPLNFQWRRNGQNLADGGTITGANASTLIISSAQPCDAGVYDFVVTSSCSSSTSASATVTVDPSALPAPAQEAKLDEIANPAPGDKAGCSVAISADTTAIGVQFDDQAGADAGAVLIHVRNAGVWSTQAKLLAADPAPGDQFGHAVAIDGNTVVIGSPQDDDNGNASGSAYIFVRTGTTWTQQAKLTAADAAADDSFGVSVAISGDTVVIGAYGDDVAGTDSGSAYVFVRSGTTWTQQARLTPADGAAFDSFGASVGISGDTAIVGANLDDDAGSASGSAYVFVRSGTAWSQQAKLTASDAAADDNFGISVGVWGNAAVIGASGDNAPATDSGSAYVFERSGMTWTQRAKLTPADAAAGDAFGISVAISGDTVVVGSIFDDDAGTDSGSAYVFARCGATWIQRAKLTAQDAAAGDNFGQSVAADADAIAVGAPTDDAAGGADQGGSYIFRQPCPVSAIPFSVLASPICSGQNVDVLLAGSQAGVSYQLRQAATPLGAPVLGTGGPIALSATLTSATTQTFLLNVLGTKQSSGCKTQLSQTGSVQVIQILAPPSNVAAAPNNYCINVPATVQLTASGGSGTQLQWYQGSCGGTFIGAGGSLSITPPTQSTIFYARWQGTCGPSSCQAVGVNVFTPLVFNQQPQSQAACEGGSVTFTVAATSSPAPLAYRWRRNFTNLSDGGSYSGVTTPSLTVSPVTAALAGNYDCVITSVCNIAGSQIAELSIPDGAPAFLIQPDAQVLCAGQELVLYATASGNPPPHYQWRRNGFDIPGGNTQLYNILHVAPGDSGTYDVVATNGCYSTSSNAVSIAVHPTGTGDGNGDGLVNGRDVAGFVDAILQWDGAYSLAYCAYDMTTDDGYVDELDLPLFINALLTAP